jgi:2-dehydro-3-deoxyphosphooctonate aldolase (KDO 8-P synthase)
MNNVLEIGPVRMGAGEPLCLLAGLCVLEGEQMAVDVAEELKRITGDVGIPLIFKASYDKANRTSVESYRGPGLEKGLPMLERVRREVGIPVLTDVHQVEEVQPAAGVVDMLQVPAFLCRQTDLLVAVGQTGKPVNVKKGQFMAPWDMKNVVGKISSTGNDRISICERGFSFGYNNLIFDPRAIPIMREFGYPVVFDATHSVQLPGGTGTTSGGQREYVEPLSYSAISSGADGLFLEVHPEPERAKSDGPNSLRLGDVKGFLERVWKLSQFVRDEMGNL